MDYDNNICIRMCEISAASYKDLDEATTEFSDLGLECLRFFDKDGTQAFLLKDGYDYILSFRGTEVSEIQDILSDLDFDLVTGPLEGLVHEGFNTALSKIWESVKEALVEYEAEYLWITGHSLGGALATLAAAYIIQQGTVSIKGVYTFGSPHVGNAKFSNSYGATGLTDLTFRIVNNNDVVPMLLGTPPVEEYEFTHVGRFHYIPELGGEPIEDPSLLRLVSDKALGIILDVGESGIDGLKDHKIDGEEDGYLQALTK
jgi:triacylglycerol lipase